MSATPSSPDGGGTQAERRADLLGREAFELAVTSATKAATQQVARIHRVRLVTQTAMVTALVIMGFGVIIALLLVHSERTAAQRNATYDCRVIKTMGAALAAFVDSDADLRARQSALSVQGKIAAGFSHLFGKATFAAAVQESAKINGETVHYWRTVVEPKLNNVAGQNCVASIG